MKKIIPCYLDIESFVGISVGATHSYGHLKCDNKTLELKHRLTKKEADFINYKDGDGYNGYKKGDLSKRFDTEEQIIKLALKTWKKYFPNANILIRGSATYAEPRPCLAGPKKIKDRINYLYEKAEELGWWDNGNDEEVEKICDEWWHKILGK